MKKGKVAGCSGVCADMIKILEESGVDIMVDIIGTVWEEEEMPEDWKQSEIVPIYKQKGDPWDEDSREDYRREAKEDHGDRPHAVWLYAREGNHRRHLHLPAKTRKTSRKKSRIVHNFC